MDQQQILQMALQRCRDPRMVNLIQNNFNNPQQLIQELCKNYPDQARQIDSMIGQGQNPMSIAMMLLNKR